VKLANIFTGPTHLFTSPGF